MAETIIEIPLDELHPFPDHPFGVRDDDMMQQTVESVREYGVIVPGIARPREDGGYEIVSGHRRKHACELASLKTMPFIIRDIDRNTATIIMVDSNLQRENILPSEKAKAYKMKLEAIKRRAGRPGRNSVQVGQNYEGKTSREQIAENSPDSATQIQRYIRLTELEPELLQMVDEGKIGMTPAVEISYLNPDEQMSACPLPERCRLVFHAAWRYLIDTPDVCRFFTYYYHSPNFEKYAQKEYQIQLDELAETILPRFDTMEDAKHCLYALFVLLNSFAILVVNQETPDEADAENRAFNTAFYVIEAEMKKELPEKADRQ